jgi:hypothetical protein
MPRRRAPRPLTPVLEAFHARLVDSEARMAHALDTGQATA